MKINHPSVRSDVFKLVTTLEFDLEIGGHFLPTRVELFRDTARARRWRCRLWERDLYRLEAPEVRPAGARPTWTQVDEELLVERTWELSDRFQDFEALSARKAMAMFLDRLKKHLERLAQAQDPAESEPKPKSRRGPRRAG